MGSGKSTIGRLLADKLNYNFLDTDQLIENALSESVENIFENKGELLFREVESEILNKTFLFENIIVSTGGGLVCHNSNMDKILENGIAIYLYLTEEELVERLEGDSSRPLLKNKSADELLSFIKDHLESRHKFYEKSNYKIEGSKSKEQIVNEIKLVLD